MINNPELINRIINQLKNVPVNVLDEVVTEILEEDKCFDSINKIPIIEYKKQTLFKNAEVSSDLSCFDFLHINRTKYSKIEIPEVA